MKAEWKPIETAPKDKKILVYGSGHVYLCRLNEYRECLIIGGFGSYHPPTHWMPLPEPPSEPTDNSKQEKEALRA